MRGLLAENDSAFGLKSSEQVVPLSQSSYGYGSQPRGFQLKRLSKPPHHEACSDHRLEPKWLRMYLLCMLGMPYMLYMLCVLCMLRMCGVCAACAVHAVYGTLCGVFVVYYLQLQSAIRKPTTPAQCPKHTAAAN